MKRRDFLKSSLTASTLAAWGATGLATAGAEPAASREYYELRAYRLKAGGDPLLLDTFLEKAAIPAWNRLGIQPVGVFSQLQDRVGQPARSEVVDPSIIFVLLPHPSVDSVTTTGAKMLADAEYQQAGADFLHSRKANPGFDRVDSWLLLAFSGAPKLERPDYSVQKQPRMFEMRTYESYSELKSLNKVQMFNSGEIETMHTVGLGPIFFGHALLGSGLPQLTYMVSGTDEAAHKQHWAAFNKHPVFVNLGKDPQYADNVSKVINHFLAPKPYSQI